MWLMKHLGASTSLGMLSHKATSALGLSPFPAALTLPSPLRPLPGTKWHAWAWGHWELPGNAVVQDPNKPFIQDLKTSIAGAIPEWEQARGPASPGQGAPHEN